MESQTNRKLLLVALALIAFGVTMRLVPHMPNFAPVGAIALFGGAILPRKLSLWLPLAIMAASDLIIGFYPGVQFTWAAFLMVALFGMALRRTSNLGRVIFGSFAGATIFYAVSNFGVWLQSGMYPHTWQGLADCYLMALPFFRNTLAGDLVYSAVLFGAYALATKRILAPAAKAAAAR